MSSEAMEAYRKYKQAKEKAKQYKQEQKEEQLDIPPADAVMEVKREINMWKAYPQDVTLSTSPRDSEVFAIQIPVGRELWKEFSPKTTPSIQL